ncbi:MAG: response regulator [bacterium]|nr:response regulator [bacterium]
MQPNPYAISGAQNSAPPRILVVEDAHSLRRDIVEMLGFEGYQVFDAENGKRGVERAREVFPDLIICDIMMPIMSGLEVLAELRADKATATIPFIFLTARTDKSDIRMGMQSGADDYVTKPFTAAELIAAVKARLDRMANIEASSKEAFENIRANIITAMPHELRTPLNVIMGFSNLLMMDSAFLDSARVEDMSTHINSAANRLYRLVENYITYAYTELLISDPNRNEVLRAGFMYHPGGPLQLYAQDRAAHFHREADLQFDVHDTEQIAIHDEYFKKIVDELVDNACKFSAAGTPVIVRARRDAEGFHLEFADQGRGMKPEQIKVLGAYMQFERRFYEQQGSGLGLINSKRLAELHGGKLWIESVVGKGTTVHVLLPVERGAAL